MIPGDGTVYDTAATLTWQRAANMTGMVPLPRSRPVERVARESPRWVRAMHALSQRSTMRLETIKAFAQKRSVLIYFALTVAISWTGAIVLLGPRAFPLNWERFEKFGAALYAVILAGPCVASLLLTSLIDGRPGLRALLSASRRWRLGVLWYAFALAPALLLTASQLVLSRFFPAFVPVFFSSDEKGSTVLLSLGVAVVFGIFEEIGWTGFAVPRLRRRHTVLTTGLAVGLVWGAWHFPLFWQRDSFSAVVPVTLLIVQLFSWLPPFRVLMAWVYDRTGSSLVVMPMHASIVFAQLILRPGQLGGTTFLASVLVTPATMWLLVALLLVLARCSRLAGSVGPVYHASGTAR
jgi:uncharacterized protein